ncbi:MAG TPA: hypothetical protein VFY61_03495 [Pyrinomonadaceae bacterium]|nr:hypothetical protein [Pyrinomonadaceae bacterium]
MKNVRQELDDSLRAEYKRSDFGEMVQGKYATTQVELAEIVRLLLACIAEDGGLKFIQHSAGVPCASRKQGDWTYEFDDANQITLRYWISEFGSIEESVSNPHGVNNAQERSALQQLLLKQLRTLKTRVDAL